MARSISPVELPILDDTSTNNNPVVVKKVPPGFDTQLGDGFVSELQKDVELLLL